MIRTFTQTRGDRLRPLSCRSEQLKSLSATLQPIEARLESRRLGGSVTLPIFSPYEASSTKPHCPGWPSNTQLISLRQRKAATGLGH